MRQYIQITFAVLILSSCGHRQNKATDNSKVIPNDTSTRVETAFSIEFLEYFENSEMTLRGDSIILPVEADSVIVLIPKHIPKNQETKFESENGNSITLRQVNYTDIEFEIKYYGQKISGKASLPPTFHLGIETVEFSDGEYEITHYYVTETENPCIDFIGLGNQNIAEENPENIYAMVSVSGDNCFDKLKEMTDKKLKRVAKKRYVQ